MVHICLLFCNSPVRRSGRVLFTFRSSKSNHSKRIFWPGLTLVHLNNCQMFCNIIIHTSPFSLWSNYVRITERMKQFRTQNQTRMKRKRRIKPKTYLTNYGICRLIFQKDGVKPSRLTLDGRSRFHGQGKQLNPKW